MPAFSRFLRYFMVVGRTGSIRKAADELHVSASAIDRQILNAEAELAHALRLGGAQTEYTHFNQLLKDGGASLEGYQILALPGGFSFGDDIQAGRVLANKFRRKIVVASTSEVDFVEGVGTVTMKRITLTDESSCSANVAINPMGAQGEFEVVSNCGALNPGDSCTMTVTFLPTNVGRSVASWEVVVLGQQYSFTAVGVGE